MASPYPRDLVGYGANPPDPEWPGGARLALEFALNYEAGGESCVLDGDAGSEDVLTDLHGYPAVSGQRSMLGESTFEYGARVGVWRILRLFAERGVKISVFATGLALERNPEAARAISGARHEIVAHGWRWIDYQHAGEADERNHIGRAVAAIESLTGSRPLGWFTGRPGPHTRRLVAEEGGFLYDQDALNDELPYWVEAAGKPHLVLPYSFETNDNAFSGRQGFSTGVEFFTYLKEAFDVLYAEGATAPRMMTVGLHDRLVGRPGRFSGLARFLDYVLGHEDLWICRDIDIARHWRDRHPYGA